jgi:signal transduction histidine kinase
VWWVTAAVVAGFAVAAAAGGDAGGFDIVELASWLLAASATAATVRLVVTWWRTRVLDDPLPGWLAAGSVVAWLAVVPDVLDVGWHVPGEDVAGPLLLLATVPLLVVGAIVTVLRERPGRYHGVAHEVIGWLALSGSIVVLYTGVVAGLGRFVGGDGPTWLLVATTGILAVSVDPARRRIRSAVDRLVWGARDDPLEVVRGVVDHVGADSGEELLPALVATLQRELRLDAVAIDVKTADGWRREAAIGPATTYVRAVALEQRDEVVGRLVIGWEHGPSLRARDERILAELAGPLGLAVGWVRLAADLRRSSVAIVSAREEERRRLRRDLHDGLGPALTGVSLGMRTAVRQLQRTADPDGLLPTRLLLTRAADEVDALVGEVKRIVRDLRPTALDQLGLVDAVAEFTRTFADDLEIHLSMPSTPVELPAAVEVATYRIVTEAVTNVVRHAHAARCWLTISTGSTIDIDVVDDGVGVDDSAPDGVGWTAMRERAAELGGSVQVTAHRPHGTRVHVRLPAVLP